jgi:hypothetical protein
LVARLRPPKIRGPPKMFHSVVVKRKWRLWRRRARSVVTKLANKKTYKKV